VSQTTKWPAASRGRFPKRELRAAWIATVDHIDWPPKGVVDPEQQKREFVDLLEQLKSVGINAVIVQIRPTSDAFYPSKLVPWSEWLTGKQGTDPGYDPLAFMLEEAHLRNMEFHAWFNPYRVSLQDEVGRLADNHPARRIGVIPYGGKLYFDPGDPFAREHIIECIMEVVEAYDIDAVHFDDYFYPYPVVGVDFPDEETYRRYGRTYADKADWRRSNVNLFVKEISRRIKEAKRHVKFGISPFGIWRNKSEDPNGSDTEGLSGYDALFADAKWWVEDPDIKLDYIIPQLYWPLGTPAVSYDKLANWWRQVTGNRDIHLYAGHALYKVGSMNADEWADPEQLPNQIIFNRVDGSVKGSAFFSARWFAENRLGVTDRLKNDLYAYPALVPPMPWIDRKPPAPPVLESVVESEEGVRLTWTSTDDDAAYDVIYRFEGEGIGDVEDPRCMVGAVRRRPGTLHGRKKCSYVDTTARKGRRYTYVVTSADRTHNESAPSNAMTLL
jgi:uncharacterized lipoprotein YddW (UPF0748 family)